MLLLHSYPLPLTAICRPQAFPKSCDQRATTGASTLVQQGPSESSVRAATDACIPDTVLLYCPGPCS